MGTFDILNMRINGYDFHVSLMAGKESWEDAKVKTVFDTWKGMLPLHQPGSLGRTWQEAAQGSGEEGRHVLLGTFATQQFQPAPSADVDFFAFPEVDSAHGTDSIDAPIDGYMMSAKPKNEAGAKALLEYLASAEAENIYLKSDPSVIGDEQERRHGWLQRRAEEVGRDRRRPSEHRAVHGPRHPAGLRVDVMIPACRTSSRTRTTSTGSPRRSRSRRRSIFVG